MNKKDIIDMDAVDIYKEVLYRKYIKIFPMGFWQRPEALSNAIKVTKYLIEEKLKWNDKDIKEKLNKQIFINNKLRGMLKTVFNNSPYKAINSIYPGKFNGWELCKVPNNYWNKKTAREATKWLIEEKLKWSDDDIKEKLNKQIFIDNGLHGMISNVFNNSPYNAYNNAYPGKFKKDNFKNFRRYKNKGE